MITRPKAPARLKPSAEAASHWPLSTALMPLLSTPDTDTANMMPKAMMPTVTGLRSTEANTTK